jgi:hypothetical protein
MAVVVLLSLLALLISAVGLFVGSLQWLGLVAFVVLLVGVLVGCRDSRPDIGRQRVQWR